MITFVLLFLVPGTLSLSLYRLVQVPRDLRVRKAQINPRRRRLACTALGLVYGLLAGDTLLVLWTIAGALWSWPVTWPAVLEVAYIVATQPLVCLAFEWILYYTVHPAPVDTAGAVE